MVAQEIKWPLGSILEIQIWDTTSYWRSYQNNQLTQRLSDMESHRHQQVDHTKALLLGNWEWIHCTILARFVGWKPQSLATPNPAIDNRSDTELPSPQSSRLLGGDRPKSLRMANLDPSTANLQESLRGRHPWSYGGACENESPNPNESIYPKMGILDKWHIHPSISLLSPHDPTYQQCKRYMEVHMALKSMAKNNFLSLANPTP